jgi:hypothetical protein
MDKSKFNNRKEWKKFAIGLSIIVAIIATIQYFYNHTIYIYLYISSILILLIGLISPIIIKPIFILFSYLGFVLGWFMTRLILAFLFYLIFTPIGLLIKLTGKKLLDTKFPGNGESYWIDRDNSDYTVENYERQF